MFLMLYKYRLHPSKRTTNCWNQRLAQEGTMALY
jgi:hypothetical protein